MSYSTEPRTENMMALNPDLLPEFVLDDLHERELTDSQVKECSVREAMNEYLNWNGIIGYTSNIIDALDGIRAAEINPVVKPIAYYYVLVKLHELKPQQIRCDSEDEVLGKAKQDVLGGLDPFEVSQCIMIVNNDGSVTTTQYTTDDVTPD